MRVRIQAEITSLMQHLWRTLLKAQDTWDRMIDPSFLADSRATWSKLTLRTYAHWNQASVDLMRFHTETELWGAS